MATIHKTKASRRHLFYLASGKVGLTIVKQYDNKMVLCNLPDMSRRKLSPKQKQNNRYLAKAQKRARDVNSNPVLKEHYTKMHNESVRKFRSLSNFVVSHHLRLQKEERSLKD